jgi:nucleoside-diphosphate-sugar epimerase
VKQNRVLVVGAGDVGLLAAQKLAQTGFDVVALRRSEVTMPKGVTLLRADITDADSLRSLADYRFDYVVVTTAAGSRDETIYRRVYVDGLQNVLAQLAKQIIPVQRIVLASSTGVYGQSHGEWVDETSPTEPAEFSGRIQLEAEQLAHDSGIASTVVRLGGIYGPGRERLIRQVKALEFCAQEPAHYTNRIYRDDAARLLAFIVARAQQEQELAACYIGVDSEPTTLYEVQAYLAAKMGIIMRAGTQVPPRGSKRCRNALILRTGFKFHYPNFRIGYGAIMEQRERAL